MIQSSQVMNSIGKQRCIHRHPISGILRSICQNASLQRQFADIPTGIVIPVYNESTGLTDIGLINLANFIQNSTSATEFGSMIRIDFIERDRIFFTQTSETMKEFSIRNFVDNLISLSSFRISLIVFLFPINHSWKFHPLKLYCVIFTSYIFNWIL